MVRIKSLEVPGENTVRAQGGLDAMAEEVKPITYIEVLEDEPTETLIISASCEVTTDGLSPSAVTVSRRGDGDDSGGGSSGGSGSGGRAGLPRMGDGSGSGRGLGALGIAAASLGAGMAACSKRRTELEAEETSERDCS